MLLSGFWIYQPVRSFIQRFYLNIYCKSLVQNIWNIVATESSPCSNMFPLGVFDELPDKLFTDFRNHIIIFRGMYDSLFEHFFLNRYILRPFQSYIGPRPTLWFSCSAPMSENVRHCFCCVCSPAVRACPTLFLM
jgi:hypothetical protein